MRILYWYTRFLDEYGKPRNYHNLDAFELNLSTDIKYHFDSNTRELIQEPYSTPLPKGFWGDALLYNLNAIVGNNGVGKTTVIHTVLNTLQELFDRDIKSQNETIFIVEINKSPYIVHLTGANKDYSLCQGFFREIVFNMDIKAPKGQGKLQNQFLKSLERTKLIYLTNTLSEVDDSRYHATVKHQHARNSFIYDCSLCGTIRYNSINDCWSDGHVDLLNAYFTNEYYKQVKFVCDSIQNKKLSQLQGNGLQVPIPKQLYITIRECKHIVSSQNSRESCIDSLRAIPFTLAHRLCLSCILTFIDNLNISDDPQLNQIYELIPPVISFYDYFYSLDTLTKYYLSSLSSQEIEEKRDRIWRLQNRCMSFIDFICSNVKQLEDLCVCQSDIKSTMHWKRFTFSVPVNNNSMTFLIEFMQLYRRTCDPYYFLDFNWGLSSGENNLLRLFSSLFYVFHYSGSNLYNSPNTKNENKCDSVILFMDEADLTYHPEWQRQLIQILTAFLPLEFGDCGLNNLQVLLTTHSPLLLGDIPANNVVYLGKSNTNGTTCEEKNTFGQNIHTILKDSFFLCNGTVGAFAASKINQTAKTLRSQNLSAEDLRECKTIIDLVAPGVLKGKLLELYDDAIKGRNDSPTEILQGYVGRMSTEELDILIESLEEEKQRRAK